MILYLWNYLGRDGVSDFATPPKTEQNTDNDSENQTDWTIRFLPNDNSILFITQEAGS